MTEAEWLLESQKDVQLLPGPESGAESHDNWPLGELGFAGEFINHWVAKTHRVVLTMQPWGMA